MTTLKKNIATALGEEKALFAIRNVKIFHMTDGSVEEGDILINGDRIVGAGACCKDLPAEKEFDAEGAYALPGFIDTHVHIESSMLTPGEYEKCVLPHGVTTVVCDPHELSNVAGTAAWDYFISCADHMAMDLIIRLSSCVPATHLETSGAEISSKDILAYAGRKHVCGLGEMMNVPGVLFRDEEILKKLLYCTPVDGHAPLLKGNPLNAYLVSGVENCHESTCLEEAEEKLRRGMNILIREGSTAKNLEALYPLITLKNSPFLAFCTDDRNPADIRKRRHIDGMIAYCIEKGADILAVYRTATMSAARIASLPDRGIIAPGKRADIVLISDLEKCKVEHTFAAGKKADETLFASLDLPPVPETFLHSIRREKICVSDLVIKKEEWRGDVIGIIPGNLITEKIHAVLPEKEGILYGDEEQDIQKLFVLERHGKNGNIGKGFVQGFGMRCGAIATSVGHDSHNICVTGTNDEDIVLAVNLLIEKGGGFTVVREGKILAFYPLEVGGLMSQAPFEETAKALEEILAKVRETSCKIEEPFMALAFLPLPVIPAVKLTDKGLVDVEKFCFY
ncbi:MAG: adenine deaminase [Lentisphaeria bacterium]|nr:adenine deaminase [Lentisphaeria bacterium]